jgi:hypothetical protein
MNWQEFFYIVASICLILFGLVLIAMAALIIVAMKAIKDLKNKSKSIAESWKKISVTNFIFKIIKLFF